MWLCKCVRSNNKNSSKTARLLSDVDNEEDRREEERVSYTEEELHTYDGIKLVYFACTTPNQDLINTLHSFTRATIEVSKYCFIFVKIYKSIIFVDFYLGK